MGRKPEETLGEDSPLATWIPATPATEVQPEDHRNRERGNADLAYYLEELADDRWREPEA
jgi:hypothetical protein